MDQNEKRARAACKRLRQQIKALPNWKTRLTPSEYVEFRLMGSGFSDAMTWQERAAMLQSMVDHLLQPRALGA